ncbi:exocyst complex component EXO70H1-like [Wolffia australiana]
MAMVCPSHGTGARTASPSATLTPSTSTPPSRPHSLNTAMMEENISLAEEILANWNRDGSSSSSPEFLNRLFPAITNLHRSRKFFLNESSADTVSSSFLIQSQAVMDKAVKRLQFEFHRIIKTRRDVLQREELCFSPPTHDVAADLRSIAHCMVYCGHGKECIDVYRLVRRSVVEEGLYNIGFDRSTLAQIKKLSWDALEDRICSWVGAAKTAVRNIFAGEHTLCRQTFSSSSVEEALFGEIIGEDAAEFFAFPELVVSKTRLSPEKMFRLLDMYETILELLPEIESVFSHESTSNVRAQVEASLTKLGEAVRLLLEELESAIKKDNTKAIIPGGGLHPLARYVANFVSLLAEYERGVADIFFKPPLRAAAFISAPPSPKHEAEDEENPFSGVSRRLGNLIFVLLCKLDAKARLYGEPALGYLFLANNLWYLVRKVQRGKLIDILGEGWVTTHAARARIYAARYERLAWKDVLETISGDSTVISNLEEGFAPEQILRFNSAFDAACRKQAGWVTADKVMERELKLSISQKVMSGYRPLYVKCREEGRSGGVIHFTPEELAKYISGLLCDGPGSSVFSDHGSSDAASSCPLSLDLSFRVKLTCDESLWIE